MEIDKLALYCTTQAGLVLLEKKTNLGEDQMFRFYMDYHQKLSLSNKQNQELEY